METKCYSAAGGEWLMQNYPILSLSPGKISRVIRANLGNANVPFQIDRIENKSGSWIVPDDLGNHTKERFLEGIIVYWDQPNDQTRSIFLVRENDYLPVLFFTTSNLVERAFLRLASRGTQFNHIICRFASNGSVKVLREMDDDERNVMDDYCRAIEPRLTSIECDPPLPIFATYSDYLQSDIWQAKRAHRLEIDLHRCRTCNDGERLEVHHVRYPKMLGTEGIESDLITLCHDCHLAITAVQALRRNYVHR